QTGRNGPVVSIQKTIEPIKLPVQAFDQMSGLARSGQIMVFAGKHHDFCGRPKMFERSEPLLSLFERNTEIIVRMQNQSRRFDVFRVFQRRAIPIKIEFLKQVAAEIVLVTISAVARPLIRDEIHDAPERDGRLEPGGMTDDPIGQKAAVTAAGYAHTVDIDPRVAFERLIDAVHYVDIILSAPFTKNSPFEFLT